MSQSPFSAKHVRISGRGFAAYLPMRRNSRYLGTYPSAELAYRAVLEAQAILWEERAAAYRARAEEVVA